MSYYNGLRLCAGESIDGELDETGYAIYLESNLRKDKDAKHLDIPTKVQCSGIFFFFWLIWKTLNDK